MLQSTVQLVVWYPTSIYKHPPWKLAWIAVGFLWSGRHEPLLPAAAWYRELNALEKKNETLRCLRCRRFWGPGTLHGCQKVYSLKELKTLYIHTCISLDIFIYIYIYICLVSVRCIHLYYMYIQVFITVYRYLFSNGQNRQILKTADLFIPAFQPACPWAPWFFVHRAWRKDVY